MNVTVTTGGESFERTAPADEEYRAEWGSETMWVWRWRRAPGKPEGEK